MKKIFILFIFYLLYVGNSTAYAVGRDSTDTTSVIEPPVGPFLTTPATVKHQFLSISYATVSSPAVGGQNYNGTNYLGTSNTSLRCPNSYQLASIEEHYFPQPAVANPNNRDIYIQDHYRYAPYCDFANSSSNYQCQSKRWLRQMYRQDGLKIYCVQNQLNWETLNFDSSGNPVPSNPNPMSWFPNNNL